MLRHKRILRWLMKASLRIRLSCFRGRTPPPVILQARNKFKGCVERRSWRRRRATTESTSGSPSSYRMRGITRSARERWEVRSISDSVNRSPSTPTIWAPVSCYDVIHILFSFWRGESSKLAGALVFRDALIFFRRIKFRYVFVEKLLSQLIIMYNI